MLTIREFHGKDEEDNKIEEKIRNDIKQMLTESNTINDEADKDFINTLQNQLYQTYVCKSILKANLILSFLSS